MRPNISASQNANDQSSSLLQLPQELFEIVSEHLGHAEISWLRLTCKNLQDRTYHRFRKRFSHRETDLSTNSLQKLVDAASHEEFGSAIQDLTIVTVTYDHAYLKDFIDKDKRHAPNHYYQPAYLQGGLSVTDLTPEQLAQAKWEYNLFTQSAAEQPSGDALERQLEGTGASRNASTTDPEEDEKASLALTMLTIAFSQLGRLRTLSLEAAVYKMAAIRLPAYKCTEWPHMWKKGSSVFSAIMTTIAESRIRVERLNVYGGPWGCSVSTFLVDDLVNTLRDQGLKHAFGGLKALTLCMSLPTRRHDNPYAYQAPTEKDDKGLTNFLSLCPDLEELDTHVYQLSTRIHDSERMFTEVSDNIKLPRLIRCTLRGMELREDDLMTFLRNCPKIQIFEMRKISLKRGDWRQIFDYCSSIENTIGKVTLRRLSDHRLLSFSLEETVDSFTVEGEELKRGIVYQNAPRGADPERIQANIDYGPPETVPLRLKFDGITGEALT